MNNSFKSELEEKSTVHICSFDKFLDYDFYGDIASLISNNENHNTNLEYVFFVNQIISKQIRKFLIDFCSASADKVDIDSFQFYGIKFRVERNTVSNINFIRPDVRQILPQDYHKVIILKIQ